MYIPNEIYLSLFHSHTALLRQDCGDSCRGWKIHYTLAGCAHFPDSLDNSRRLDHFLQQTYCCWYRHIHLYGGVYLCNMLQVVVLQLHYHCHTHKMQCLCSRICGSILEIATIFTTIVSSYNNSYTNSGIYSTH